MGWEKHIIVVTVLAFGVMLGVIVGSVALRVRYRVEGLEETIGDLAIRMARVERALPGGGPDALRDIVGDVSVRVDRLERLVVLENQLRRGLLPSRGSQPAVPGQDLRGMTIPDRRETTPGVVVQPPPLE